MPNKTSKQGDTTPENGIDQVIETTEVRETVQVVDTREITNDVRQKEVTRIKELTAIGKRFDMIDKALTAIDTGVSVDQFRQEVLTKLETVKTIDTGAANIDLSTKEVKQYSFAKIIKAAMLQKPEIAAFEHEVSSAAEKKLNRSAEGIWIPHDVLLAKSQELHKREILTTGAGVGLVGTDHMPQNFIELLRNNMVVSSLGPLVLTGLTENVAIPKQAGAATAAWEDPESTAVTPSDSTYGNITLSPKISKASTEYSNKTLKQALPSIEALVLSDITQVIALSVDLAAWNGSGASGQPEGILNTTGIHAITGTDVDWIKIVQAETDVMGANALAQNNAYVTNPATMGLLKTREKFANTGERLWDQNNTVNGYPGVVSTQIPAATIIYGSFNQLILAFWGALDLIINPFSLDTKGATRITGAQAVDVGVRHAQSFTAITAIT